MLTNNCKYRIYPKNNKYSYNYIVVEIRDIIEYYLKLDQYNSIYKKFPLRDMITTLLSVKQDLDFSDKIFSELENRLEDLINYVDLYHLELFFEFLIRDIDDEIKNKCPDVIDISEFIIDSWLSDYTVVLKKIS